MGAAGAACSKSPVEPAATIRVPRLSNIQKGDPEATLKQEGRRWQLIAPRQWTYAAGVRLLPAGKAAWSGTVQVRCQVNRGRISIGLLKRENRFLLERDVTAGSGMQELSLPISSSDDIGQLILRSSAPGGEISEAAIESVDVLLAGNRLANAVNWNGLAATDGVGVERGEQVKIRTLPQPYSFAVRIPVNWAQSRGGLALVQIRAQVSGGAVGFGIQNKDGGFGVIEFEAQHPDPGDVVVAVPAPADAGDLIVMNAAKDVASEIQIYDLQIWSVR